MGTKQLRQFFVGTYSEKGDFISQAHGEGIVSCTLDLRLGHIQRINFCGGITNATYLTKRPAGNVLFAADDHFSFHGEVKAFTIDHQGALTQVSSGNTYGTGTCHIACDSKGRRVFVSSYGNGKLTVYKFNGRIFSSDPQIISYEGAGPMTERQKSSHIHQAIVSPSGKWLYACDLGSDRIWLHDLLDISGHVEMLTGIKVPAGYGPRHLICHPILPFAYLFCELNSRLLTYSIDDQTGQMTLLAEDPTLPASYMGTPSGAAIKLHPSMKALYASNRMHNSLAVFSIDVSGQLKSEGYVSSRGKEPRDFDIDPTGRWLLVANQDSDNIVPIELDPILGIPTGNVALPFQCSTPVCILFNN